MDSLPCDVVNDVLALLPPRSLAAARCVCKAWRAAVDAGGLLRADLLPLTVGGVFTQLFHELQPPEFLRPPSSSKKVSGDLGYVGIDSDHGMWLPRITDCCNGLLLLNNCVVNPATRRWARLPPCPPLPEGRGRKDGYLLYNDGTQRWEDRSIVREGEAIAVPDLLQSSAIHYYSAYCHGSLYMHFEEGYLVRLTLSDDKYQVIKTPALAVINPSENGLVLIGKSKGGIYCAFTCEYQLRIWFLHEFGAETEWILVHETDLLVAIEARVHHNIDGPWILQSPWMKNLVEDGTTEEGVLEWDFDTDNIPDVDIQDVDTRCYDGAHDVRIIGFHPYKEVIFLHHLNCCYAVAYHWNSSKVQYMSRKLWTSYYEERAESYFIYSPCWTGDLSEDN
ncbi:unnamed protein product [Urochloa decumbens]|uniref:F-box domain-containing protein n=1 Tax=Urochloa decumbens TaxID=240449 RepID=A0ABC9D9S9_9POAL